jgi:sugar phosphate isomerase/epimerase
MAEDNTVENIYQGGYSSLNPDYGNFFSGYRMSTELLGTPSTTPGEQGDIITNLGRTVSTGQKVVEISLLTPEMIDSIPKQHLEEVNRVAKLTGADLSVHGPVLDASGFTERGFDEQNRELTEKRILRAIESSHKINPDGGVPVTFHTANQIPGTVYSKTKEGEQTEFMAIVNQETGQISGAKRDVKFYPEHDLEKGEPYSVEKQLDAANNTEWDKPLQVSITEKEHADRILRETFPLIQKEYPKIIEGKIKPGDLPEPQKQAYLRFQNANEQLRDVRAHLSSMFNTGYKFGDKKTKKYLSKLSNNFRNKIIIEHNGREYSNPDPMMNSNALQELMGGLSSEGLIQNGGSIPKVFKSAEEYGLEKGQETFGNAAWESYKRYGNKAPIVSIENPPAGMALSRAEDVKGMVEGARKQFENNAIKEGMSKGQAEKQAEKLIGATWDVGHINQLRKFGFSSEDIIKEAEKIAPFVKHVHLSDNFGIEDTELPMGMGNVDLKEVMEKLGKKGKDAKKIVEAAHWLKMQKSSPFGVSLEALGSPIYGMNMAPYWNQSLGLQQDYSSGYGMMLPPINYETFGAGFSNLPMELGGQRAGGGGRMSGTPME